MEVNRLFRHTRIHLAGWYAGVMGIILGLCGLGVWHLLTQNAWRSVEQELTSVAGTLHDQLETKLTEPGQLPPAVPETLPGLCLVDRPCAWVAEASPRHILGLAQQGQYYLHFFDLQGRRLAFLGLSPGEHPIAPLEGWQTWSSWNHASTSNNTQRLRYRQHSLILKTVDGRPWGVMQVGKSLQHYDTELRMLQWVLGLGLPTAMFLIGTAGWGLAGRAMGPIYRSYQLMQQFTSDAAHELRTPTAALLATVESVSDQQSSFTSEIQTILSTVERQSRRLAALVQDLLLLARMDQQQQLQEAEPCCLNELLSDVVEGISVLEIAAALKLTLHLEVASPLYVIGNERQLGCALSNLILNALKYTPPGGAVQVVLAQAAHQAMVQVRDTGIGIAPVDQERIFDRFYQVNRNQPCANPAASPGTGLGLAIAQAIVHAHQGTLTVASAIDRGSTFTLRLPCPVCPSPGGSIRGSSVNSAISS
ncbi:two-component sensor histidine kinase [Synechococcales cyanobacterium C]|uniref:histidine kinase n=1 Tax=Petrachloros mirabilis ULC683 TaxID=2781853 RepID=A0A8K1ZYJ1_9CYAN|nr:two-component system sensor histidine kinase RppB [Petrachloros mirabilis]NCJ06507.1 two-component sensor histidine kinase [Petrachloros mirabilis ULC683]